MSSRNLPSVSSASSAACAGVSLALAALSAERRPSRAPGQRGSAVPKNGSGEQRTDGGMAPCLSSKVWPGKWKETGSPLCGVGVLPPLPGHGDCTGTALKHGCMTTDPCLSVCLAVRLLSLEYIRLWDQQVETRTRPCAVPSLPGSPCLEAAAASRSPGPGRALCLPGACAPLCLSQPRCPFGGSGTGQGHRRGGVHGLGDGPCGAMALAHQDGPEEEGQGKTNTNQR